MPRFVILEHDHPHLHWDLMLEAGTVLRTWRLSAPPGPCPGSAEPSFAHRLVYLTYEGPVSGNRGTVTRWDGGDFAWLKDEADRILVQLQGGRLQGALELRQQPDGGWVLLWRPWS